MYWSRLNLTGWEESVGFHVFGGKGIRARDLCCDPATFVIGWISDVIYLSLELITLSIHGHAVEGCRKVSGCLVGRLCKICVIVSDVVRNTRFRV